MSPLATPGGPLGMYRSTPDPNFDNPPNRSAIQIAPFSEMADFGKEITPLCDRVFSMVPLTVRSKTLALPVDVRWHTSNLFSDAVMFTIGQLGSAYSRLQLLPLNI